MSGRLGVLQKVWKDPASRRVVLAYLLFCMAEQGTWIAILVYAYAKGGAAAAGIAAIAQEIPAAVVAPFTSVLGDRRRDIALPATYAAQALTTAVAAVGLFLQAPVWIVIALAALMTCAITGPRPAHGAVLPVIARTPDSLTAANVATGLMTNFGNFAGPAMAGLILNLSGTGTVFAFFAVAVFFSAVLTVGVVSRVDRAQEDESPEGGLIGGIFADVREGAVVLSRDAGLRVVTLTIAARELVFGALELLMVAAAVDLIGMGEGGAGLLNGFLGLGGVVGAALSVSLIGRRRLFPAIAIGDLAFGLPLAAAAGVSTVFSVSAFVFFAGAGSALTQVAGQTLLQRVLPDDIRARGFGILEGMTVLALALGAIGASILLETIGVKGALIAAGAFAPVMLIATTSRLRSTDRAAHAPDPIRLALLRRIDIFAPLPPVELEGIAVALEPVELATGETIIRQGEPGDRFYVVGVGRLSIIKDGVAVAEVQAGGYVGEIALLRDVPRTATVTALEDTLLLALERDDFLRAVTGHSQSRTVAEKVAEQRSADRAASEEEGQASS